MNYVFLVLIWFVLMVCVELSLVAWVFVGVEILLWVCLKCLRFEFGRVLALR